MVEKAVKRTQASMNLICGLAAAGLLVAAVNSTYKNYKFNDLTYLDKIVENSTDDKRRAFRGTEQEGIDSIRKLYSQYEDAWICCDNELWIDVGREAKNTEIEGGYMQGIFIDRDYIRRRSKRHDKLLLVHPHYDIVDMTEHRCLPDPFDTRLMIEISREFYHLNPEGDIKFAIVQQTFGTTYFYLTEKGKKGNLSLTKDETTALYNQWYVITHMEKPWGAFGSPLIEHLCKELSTEEFKVEFKSF